MRRERMLVAVCLYCDCRTRTTMVATSTAGFMRSLDLRRTPTTKQTKARLMKNLPILQVRHPNV